MLFERSFVKSVLQARSPGPGSQTRRPREDLVTPWHKLNERPQQHSLTATVTRRPEDSQFCKFKKTKTKRLIGATNLHRLTRRFAHDCRILGPATSEHVFVSPTPCHDTSGQRSCISLAFQGPHDTRKHFRAFRALAANPQTCTP